MCKSLRRLLAQSKYAELHKAPNHSFLQLPPRLPRSRIRCLRSCGEIPLLLRCSRIWCLRSCGVVSNGSQQQSDYEEDSCYVRVREQPQHCSDQQTNKCTGSKSPVGWL